MALSRSLIRCIALLFSCLGLGLAVVRTGREAVTGDRAPSESVGIPIEAVSMVEPRALLVPDRVSQGLVSDPEKWLDSLASFLTRGLHSDSHKVRAIHDWVTVNVRYDTTCLPSGSAGDQRIADVLRTRRSACGGYANLFGELCRLAGLTCVTVRGYARGAGFRVFGQQVPGRFEHAWNAVMVDGSWRLVDATWDAGWFRDGVVYEQHYSTDYLFPDPAWLVYTHLPADPAWQLLVRPVSTDEFDDLPYLTAEFFRLGLRLKTGLRLVNETAGEFRVELLVPHDVSVFCLLLASDGRKTGRPVDGARTGGSVLFSVTPPSAGDWVAAVLAKPGSPGGHYTGVAFLGFRKTPAPDRQR
jgi:hypothetical protein